jgi:nitroreductase
MKSRVTATVLMVCLMIALIPSVSADENSVPDALSVLMDSRAYRDYTDEPVSQGDLDMIIACGLRSPSAVNAQPWHFTVVLDRELADRIIPTPGVVMVISVLPGAGISELNDLVSAFDCGLAVQAMYTAAQALGLGANIYWIPVAQVNGTMREVLAVPDGYEVLMILTVGHIDIDAVSSATGRSGTESKVTVIGE